MHLWCLADNKLDRSLVNVTVESLAQTHQLPAVGQWLVVQQRLDSNVSFDQPWYHYKNGLKMSNFYFRVVFYAFCHHFNKRIWMDGWVDGWMDGCFLVQEIDECIRKFVTSLS